MRPLAAIVPQQAGRSVVRRDEQVQIAVVVVVAVGRAAADDRLGNGLPDFGVASSNLRDPRLRKRCGGCAYVTRGCTAPMSSATWPFAAKMSRQPVEVVVEEEGPERQR